MIEIFRYTNDEEHSILLIESSFRRLKFYNIAL
jgi:hypothetical protein